MEVSGGRDGSLGFPRFLAAGSLLLFALVRCWSCSSVVVPEEDVAAAGSAAVGVLTRSELGLVVDFLVTDLLLLLRWSWSGRSLRPVGEKAVFLQFWRNKSEMNE